MDLVTLLLLLLSCISLRAVGAQRVFTFEPCVPKDPLYERYDSGSALIQIDPKGEGGSINWNFCAWTATPLLHVKKLRVAFHDDSKVPMATHDVSICNAGGTDCLAQLRAHNNPSCLHGSKSLPWLRLPNTNTTAKLSLIEPGAKDQVIAEFCS